MITNLIEAQEKLSPYAPQVPTPLLLESLNKWYHAREVTTYDQSHDEIREQLPPIWQAMIETALKEKAPSPSHPWRILNFGCGTGFEATQLLERVDAEHIGELCCYDLSPEMLEKCRKRIAPLFPEARFTTNLDEALASASQFDLLATNSVLHHLPAPLETLEHVGRHLSPHAVWLAGHEPSRRFYTNDACRTTFGRYLKQNRRRRWLRASSYVGFAKRRIGITKTPAEAAAASAVKSGMLQRRPPARLVSQLVDLHVAHSLEEAQAGKGFDTDEMQELFNGQWSLRWEQSYSFMGPFFEGKLEAAWQQEAKQLASDYPRDGANFSAVWQRTS